MLKATKHITLSEFNAKEIAQELTLIDAYLFTKITTEECVQRKWDKESRMEHSPHIDALVERSNHASQWFAHEILKETEMKTRLKTIEFIIKIAKECSEIGNFAGVFYLVGSLNLKCIYRLKQTNDEIPHKSKEVLEELKNLMDSRGNFRNLRNMIKQRPTTCVPHIGLCMTDFMYIQDSSQDYLQNGYINFAKNRLLANILIEIFKWQKHRYTFDSNPLLRDLLSQTSGWKEEDLNDMSLLCEGKKRSGSGMSIFGKLFPQKETLKLPTPTERSSSMFGGLKSVTPRGNSVIEIPSDRSYSPRSTGGINDAKTGSWLNFDKNTILRKNSPGPVLTELGKKDVQSLKSFSPNTKL